MDLSNLKHVYFIGIGGIGMSAIARYFLRLGIKVSGYDKTRTLLTSELEEEGILIHFEDEVSLVPSEIDLVVYTPAIPADHQGLDFVRKQNLPLMKRSEVLGLISRSKVGIAIAGTHGKTTTSTLTAFLLDKSGLKPSAFLGGIATDYQSNFISGDSDLVVLEADEFDRSFLHLTPTIAVILSMDADHLDIYGHHDKMVESFIDFARQIKPKGLLLIKKGLLAYFNQKDLDYLSQREVTIREFGGESTDVSVHHAMVKNGQFVFGLKDGSHNSVNWVCNLPGLHNVENASVAISIGKYLGASENDMKDALAHFKGIRRRFEIIHKGPKVVFIDDYAHHPTELNAAINGVKMLFPDKKITGIFQPHLFSRTKDFYIGFAEALDVLDEIILMDIYPARELPMEGVSSEMIFQEMKNSHKVLVSKTNLMETIQWKDLEVIITLGAGDIDTFVPEIKKKLESLFL
ncbi:MAG: UDP-N-acetylmuramate--L-alanine ligase [Saprospiraceae bacterium]|nr:UDP-N-acetylmuramate--L-alanine ligase [Saprospiraceae bacterium]